MTDRRDPQQLSDWKTALALALLPSPVMVPLLLLGVLPWVWALGWLLVPVTGAAVCAAARSAG